MQSTTSSTRTFLSPPTDSEKPGPKKPSYRRRSILKNLPWIIIGVLLLVSLLLLFQYREAQRRLQFNGNSNQQIDSLISEVAKVAVLPAHETPTVATVVHADKLRGQSFFANARNGDKVLVYGKEKEAILYRPSTDQIVTIAPVTVTPTGSNLSSH